MELSLHAMAVSHLGLSSPHLYMLVAASCLLLVAVLRRLTACRSEAIYLIDFSCYRAPSCCRIPISTYIEHMENSNRLDDGSIEFQTKILERSGIGNEAALPAAVQQIPPDFSLASSLAEVQNVLFSAAQDLLAKHNVDPAAIDILVTNCSLFSPTPSMSAMVVRRFGLRSDVLSYSLSGMGCSAGIIAVDMASNLLRVNKNCLALVLTMETVTPFGYAGNVKSMLLANCLFRMGGAAILLSNKQADSKLAKYELGSLVRVDLGSDDSAYKAVIQEADCDGFVGIVLTKELLNATRDAISCNLRTLAPHVLPYGERLRYACAATMRRIQNAVGGGKQGELVPDFKKAFEHFCLHPGGKAVIESTKRSLGLSEADIEAAKMTLYRFGNTSSSASWYVFSYLEAKRRVKKGDRVWQLGLGSGVMCNSCVWRCIREVGERAENCWSDRINGYPVVVPETLDH